MRRRVAIDPRQSVARGAGIALGLLLGLFVLVDLLFRPSFVAVNPGSEASAHEVPVLVSVLHFAINLLLIVPPALAAFMARRQLEARRLAPFALLALGLAAAVIASLLANPDPRAIAYALILMLTLLAGALFAALPHGRTIGFNSFMATVALSCAACLVMAVAFNEYSWGRLASRAGPTYWGMVAIIAVACSAAVRQMWLRVAIIAVAVLTMVLASARGAMVASIVAIGVMVLIAFARAPERRRGWYLVAMVGLVLLVPLVADQFADILLKLNDPRRGIGSGATGRALAWSEAWALFANDPLLGIGYRQHERYITAATSAHQAYLAVLAEIGIIGFVFYVLLVIGGAVRLTIEAARTRDLGTSAGASFLWSYAVIGFSENLALATGLVMPLVMMFVVARAWASVAPARRAPRGAASASTRARPAANHGG